MIEVIGEQGTSEYSAAIRIAEELCAIWPGVRTTPAGREWIRIAANVKLSGYGVSDIDVIVGGVLGSGDRRFIPSRPITVRQEGPVAGKPIEVRNFLIAVEVKDHDAASVRTIGDKVSVHYSKRGKSEWKSATDQNIAQVHALVDYFRDYLGERLFVFRCLVMQGLSSVHAAGAVAYGFDGISFMTEMACVGGAQRGARGLVLSSGANEQCRHAINAPIFVAVVPTALDRRRMDSIVLGSTVANQVFERIGKRMVCLRGRGGTGKTVMLLHAAWRAFKERGFRTLVLTYNHALAADIRRLMCLLRIPSNSEEGGVTVKTVMAFMSGWFDRLHIEDRDRSVDDGYETDCQTTLDLIQGGAVSRSDIAAIIASEPEKYEFDSVVVDEAQDWPQAEADLLKALYGIGKICLADGVDQLVRTRTPTDWARGTGVGEVLSLSLIECLRMKRNLCVFANALARAAGLPWDMKPNESAAGGRVLILRKPYWSVAGLHEQLVDAARAKGNDEVDFLNCVSSSDVVAIGGSRQSSLGAAFRSSGLEIWDGTNDLQRKDFPRLKNQFRIVHYASCRGLEGWTVALHDLDAYWLECRDVRFGEGLSNDEVLGYQDLNEAATSYAWSRVSIAMTRPIDTLVISLADGGSDCASAVLTAARECQDFVEVLV